MTQRMPGNELPGYQKYLSYGQHSLSISRVLPCAALFGIYLMLSPHSQAQEKPRGTLTLTVRIEGIKALYGVIHTAVFDKAKGFPNGKNAAICQQTVDAKAETASVIFADLPTGRYAVAVRHDQNNDGRLNRNGLGIPKERYGFSNNVRGTFGPASFRASAFTLDTDKTLTIKVR